MKNFPSQIIFFDVFRASSQFVKHFNSDRKAEGFVFHNSLIFQHEVALEIGDMNFSSGSETVSNQLRRIWIFNQQMEKQIQFWLRLKRILKGILTLKKTQEVADKETWVVIKHLLKTSFA